jgi:hypothetical protein
MAGLVARTWVILRSSRPIALGEQVFAAIRAVPKLATDGKELLLF